MLAPLRQARVTCMQRYHQPANCVAVPNFVKSCWSGRFRVFWVVQFPRQANSGERRLRCHSEGDASPHAAVSEPSKVSQISAAAGRRCSKVSGPEITINSDAARQGQPRDTAIESNGRLNGHSVYSSSPNLGNHRRRQLRNLTAFLFQLSIIAFV